MSEFKNISLKQLEAVAQTRKTFDEASIQELAESIKEQGLLQPILVRPIGKKFQIIAGERRYRASLIAGLKEVACHVVEMDDKQALEAQITENLQRKDVHPMEEAHAFKRLLDDAKMSAQDIAAKVGKGTRYVAGRLKLLDLIPEFQKAFFADKFPVAGALQIAALVPEIQKEYWESDWENLDEEEYTSSSEIAKQIGWFSNELEDAKFPIDDATLLPSAGACTNCLKNTASFALLFQEEGAGRCTDRTCFQNKADAGYKRTLKEVVDSEQYLIFGGRYYTHESKLKAAKELGIELANWDDWAKVPSKPEEVNPNDFDMDDEIEKDDYEECLEDYQRELEAYNKILASGITPRKAFNIESGDIFEVVPKAIMDGNAEPGSLSNDDPKLTEKTRLLAELNELRAKRERNETIIDEKMFAWSNDNLRELNFYTHSSTALNHLEDAALMAVLFDRSGYQFQKDLAQEFHFDHYKRQDVYNWLVNHSTTDDHRRIMRAAILNTLATGDPKANPGNVAAMLPIAEDFLGDAYSEARAAHVEAYRKRNESLDKQIADIQKQFKK